MTKPNGSTHQQTPFFLEQLLSLTNDALTMVDIEGNVLYWNDEAERYYHIHKKDIIGKPIQDFFRPDDLMVLKILKSRQSVFGLYHRPRPDSHVLINASPVYDNAGELIGAISVEREISRLVKLNEELSATSQELDKLKEELLRANGDDPFSPIKGHSKEILQAISLARKVAETDATVLITGESGTGKEVFARAIHKSKSSNQQDAPFIPINCGAIPLALFESELFGYEPGAFTGADRHGKTGKLELADNGTLFLDEVGELPLDMQVKLLRVLQEQIFFRVGGTQPRKVNVRIIAATNRNLEESIKQGKFREDLYYRLNVISIGLPALRDRTEDIPELIQVFIKEFATKYEKPIPTPTPQAVHAFLKHHWPGNIRQLRNAIERIVILCDKEVITTDDLPDFLTEMSAVVASEAKRELEVPESLMAEKEELEKERIQHALRKTYGNKSAAAKLLGISRATLYHKLEKYKIPDSRSGDEPADYARK